MRMVLIFSFLTGYVGAVSPIWVIKDLEVFEPFTLQQVVVTSEGHLYVLDPGESEVWLYGPDGQRIKQIAARGTGPGEVSYAQDLLLAEDRLYVRAGGGISVFDQDGKFVKKLRNLGKGHLGKVKNGWIFSEPRFYNGLDLPPARVSWYDEEFVATKKILTWPRDPLSGRSPFAATGERYTIYFNPAPERLFLLASADGKRCYLRAPNSAMVFVLDGSWKRVVDRILIKGKAPVFAGAWADAEAAQLVLNPDGTANNLIVKKLYPEKFPHVKNMYMGPDNLLYVCRWTDNPGVDEKVLAFDEGGGPAIPKYNERVLARLVGLIDGEAVLLSFNKKTSKAEIALVRRNQVCSYSQEHPIPKSWF